MATYWAGVVPSAPNFMAGQPTTANKNATTAGPVRRSVAAVYTNEKAERRLDRRSIPDRFVIAEFHHEDDLSVPTTDSDKVALRQLRPVRAVAARTYAAGDKLWSNAGQRSNNVTARGVDGWEQHHWWWDDERSTWLEYSVFLPKGFLAPGGQDRAYPLLLAITHSGTSYDGTTEQTLTETAIATIWSLPEEQARHECVVITPRYERTTMNDYWEHTNDVENTYRLIETFLSDRWNYANPNLADRADKVLRIDPMRVYCTGWSMGAMTTLWLMARHPQTFAAGLVIAGQQRPSDMVPLAGQKLLIITGSDDNKATPWNERTVPIWREAGARVTRPAELLDPALIFPVDQQARLTAQMNAYLSQGGNITFVTFRGVDHMASARKFFYITAARDWLFSQVKGKPLAVPIPV